MKGGIAFLVILSGVLGPGSSQGTEIQGKWGLGVAIGSLFSSASEASIIRGASPRTAWIGDIVVSVVSDHRNSTTNYHYPYPDTTFVGGIKDDRMAIEVGPRLRRFAAPGSSFSPYGDVYVHFTDRYSRSSDPSRANSEVQVGGKVGIALGAEYFSTRWPFSVAAHTDVLTFSAVHASSKANGDGRVFTASGTALFGSASLRPVAQVRVYW